MGRGALEKRVLCAPPGPGSMGGSDDCTAPPVQPPSQSGSCTPRVHGQAWGALGSSIPGTASARTKSQSAHHWLSGQGCLGARGLPCAIRSARGLRRGDDIRRSREIGRERLSALNNTVGGGKQGIKHTKNCIQTTQMTVILICKCLPRWKSCHK